MTFNLDEYDEYLFTEPTWGRLKRKSPRPEDDGTPGPWQVLTEVVAHKGSDPENDPHAPVAYKSLCENYYFRATMDGRIERPPDGEEWCIRCIALSTGKVTLRRAR